MTREEAIEIINRNCTEGSKLREACTMFIPELAESEDERIRKALISYFEWVKERDCKSEWNGLKVDDIRAWLEKQKEQKSNSVPERIRPKFAVGDTVCRNMWSDHTIREIYIDCDDPVYVCVNEEGIESHISFSEQDEWKRKEQKPEERPINWTELTWEDINELEDIINKVHYEFRNGIGQESFGKEVLEQFREYKGDEYLDEEQKPAEWSEDDSRMLSDIVGYITGTGSSSGITKQERADFLYGLSKRFNLQPKQEWSDEDEKIMQTMIKDGDLKPSEVAWLKSRRPSWKPSEEHFQGLRRAITKAEKGSDAWNSLTDLYEQLKKL